MGVKQEYMSVEDMEYLDRVGYSPMKWEVVNKKVGEWEIMSRKMGTKKTIKVWEKGR